MVVVDILLLDRVLDTLESLCSNACCAIKISTRMGL